MFPFCLYVNMTCSCKIEELCRERVDERAPLSTSKYINKTCHSFTLLLIISYSDIQRLRSKITESQHDQG